MNVKVKKVLTNSELQKAFDLRVEVFVKEQGISPELELDEDDKKADHVLALHEDKAVGCGRIVYKKNKAKLGRIAVNSSFREKGIGTKVCRKLINLAEAEGCEKAFLHAQFDSADFYKKLGFETTGRVFMEAGKKHIKMQLRL